MSHPISQYLDFANHHANSTPADIQTLCEKVSQYGFHAAFVNQVYVSLVKSLFNGQIRTGTVISFPLGQDLMISKVAAAKESAKLGADELDVVPDLGKFLSGDSQNFTNEMQEIVNAAKSVNQTIIVKFILDPGYFDSFSDKFEKLKAASLCVKASGADFVKIGSGMGPRNPTLEDLKIVKEAVGETIKIKVAGGIETYAQAKAFVDNGVSRIGTSHAIEIINGSNQGS